MFGYETELQEEIHKLRRENSVLKEQIEGLKANSYVQSIDDGMEIRRLRRCLVKMTKHWLSAIDDMYSRLDDVHGLDDQDVLDWEKVADLRDKMDKVLEKWK